MPRFEKTAPRSRSLDAQEDWLWREVTRDVKRFRPLEPAISVKRSEPHPNLAPKRAPVVAALQQKPEAPPSRLGSGVDGSTARKLAQGRVAPDATLDLHGMTQDHAHAALERFLAISIAHGRRCVLVITGKGGPSEQRDVSEAPWARRRPGVLKSLAPLWLEHSANRNRIASIREAHIRHGGGGAFYVYLRRK